MNDKVIIRHGEDLFHLAMGDLVSDLDVGSAYGHGHKYDATSLLVVIIEG